MKLHPSLSQFVAERCDVFPLAKIPREQLFAAYESWSRRMGLPAVLWSVFCHELQTYLPIRMTPEHFAGVRIKLTPLVGVADRSSPWDRS